MPPSSLASITSILKNKHVLISTDDPGEGGVSQYVTHISRGLANLGVRVTIAQSEPANVPELTEKRPDVEHVWLPYQTRKDAERLLTDSKSSHEILQNTSPDLLLLANCAPVSQVAMTTAALDRGIPYCIIEGYAQPSEQMHPVRAWLLHHQLRLYKHAKVVIAVSNKTLEILRSDYGLDPRKGEVIHYGRPPHFFEPRRPDVRLETRRKLGVPEDATVCLTTARIAEVKGFDLILQASQQLRETPLWQKLYFIWAGGGPLLEQARVDVAAADLGTHVVLLGPRDDIPELLEAADIFVLPSRHEGMPLAIMEAMGKGLPVIASAVSGIPEQLGDTGILLPDPNIDSAVTVKAISESLGLWMNHPDQRRTAAKASQERGRLMFEEARMFSQTAAVLARSLLPANDYVSPGLEYINLDDAFPNRCVATPETLQWKYLRDDVPHAFYVDRRVPGTGFLNRDETVLLYNLARPFAGKSALEIGCWLGWSAAHLAAAGLVLDVIDPVLANQQFYSAVKESLQHAGGAAQVTLHRTASPAGVDELARQGRRWNFVFIDGSHEAPYPLFDAAVVAEFTLPDALVVFHDLASPDVAQGLEYLRLRGWQTCIYQTAQIMGAAWRGNVVPAVHLPDPRVHWHIPKHVRHFSVGPPAAPPA